MDKKLTLSLDQQVIDRAKKYAKRHRTSLSKLIETYFESLTHSEEDEQEILSTPLVDSLCGIIDLPKEIDVKKSRLEYLIKKNA